MVSGQKKISRRCRRLCGGRVKLIFAASRLAHRVRLPRPPRELIALEFLARSDFRPRARDRFRGSVVPSNGNAAAAPPIGSSRNEELKF